MSKRRCPLYWICSRSERVLSWPLPQTFHQVLIKSVQHVFVNLLTNKQKWKHILLGGDLQKMISLQLWKALHFYRRTTRWQSLSSDCSGPSTLTQQSACVWVTLPPQRLCVCWVCVQSWTYPHWSWSLDKAGDCVSHTVQLCAGGGGGSPSSSCPVTPAQISTGYLTMQPGW